MKKKCGLLFIMFLLIFFCVNIDGVKAKIDSGGGTTSNCKDCVCTGGVKCVYNFPSATSQGTTAGNIKVTINYNCAKGEWKKKGKIYYWNCTDFELKKDEITAEASTGADMTQTEFVGQLINTATAHDFYLRFYNHNKGTKSESDDLWKCPNLKASTVPKGSGSGTNNSNIDAGRIKLDFNSGATSASSTTCLMYSERVADDKSVIDRIVSWAKSQEDTQTIANLGLNDTICSDVLGSKLSKFLKNGFSLISIIGVILLIFLMSGDFIKVITSGEGDAMSEALKKSRNRIIAVIVLLLLPVLVNFMIDIINNNLTAITTKTKDGETITEIKIGNTDDCGAT